MRVLSLSPTPLWDVEDQKGMPSLFLGQKAFVEAGHGAIFAYGGKVDRNYDYHGITMVELRIPHFEISSERIWLHRLAEKLFWVFFLIFGFFKGYALCRKHRPDVVYGHFYYGAPVAWLLGKIWRIPNITRMYGTFLFPALGSFWRKARKLDEVLAFKIPCAYFIMTDDGTRGDDCARTFGVPEAKLKFWRNGVNKDIYDPNVDIMALKASLSIPENHLLIVAVCRLSLWKGVHRLIEALPGVLRETPNVTTVIVGDGEERGNLENLCRQLNVEKNVHFLGMILHDEVPKFLNSADIFVSLYDYSNVGNPLLEAMCCGKCIVTLDVGATGRLIQDGKNGVLLNMEDLPRLSTVLGSLIKDETRRTSLGKAARRYAEMNFWSWSERVKAEVSLIEELVKNGKARRSLEAVSAKGMNP